MKDTIFALSTVPGLSAISIFRISGPNAFSVLKMITSGEKPKSRFATLKKISWEGEVIDRCIIITFEKNESFTGEKTVEIHCHGSIAVIEKIVSIVTDAIQEGLLERNSEKEGAASAKAEAKATPAEEKVEEPAEKK